MMGEGRKMARWKIFPVVVGVLAILVVGTAAFFFVVPQMGGVRVSGGGFVGASIMLFFLWLMAYFALDFVPLGPPTKEE